MSLGTLFFGNRPKDQRESWDESWVVVRDQLPTVSAAQAPMSMNRIPVQPIRKMNGRMAILTGVSQFFQCFIVRD